MPIDRREQAGADRIARLEAELSRAERIIGALIDRVESATDFHATDSDGTNYHNKAFAIFETAVAWDFRVRARTADQTRALTDLATALAELGAAKEANEDAQRRLRDAIESINEGFAIFDADERLVLCNRTYLSLWPTVAPRIVQGMFYSDLLRMIGEAGTSLQTLVAPKRWVSERLQQRQRAAAAHVHALADGRWIQIDELRTSEGGIVVVCTDITQVKAEDAHERARELAEKSALLQATLDTIHAGVCVYDADRRLTAWNEQFLAIIGLGDAGVASVASHEALLAVCLGTGAASASSALSWLPAVTPAEVALWLPAPAVVIEVRRALMPDGGMAMSFDDVTYRVRAATTLREMNEMLELRVHERTADIEAVNAHLQREVKERVAVEAALIEAKRVAEQLNMDKTRFLAAVSHDLIQPLNAARLFVTALAGKALPEASRPLVQQAASALDSVEEILEALLELSQLDAGAIQPAIENLDLDALLHSMMIEFAPFAEQRGLDLTMASDGHWVRSDARLLRRILQNLISNALRYTDAGSVEVCARRVRNSIAIEVSDTGPGIARKDRALIFKEFGRLANRGQAGGVGLGLAIVDRTARMLDHPLKLRSRLGTGSTFRLSVPEGHAPVHRDAAARQDGPTAPLSGRRVLVIDNEAASLAAFEALLATWGCAVVAVQSQGEALVALARLAFTPEIVIADLHLDDGMMGDEVVATLEARTNLRLQPIIVTADRDEQVRKRLAARGFFVLDKPVRPNRLRAVMQYVVTAAQA